MTGFSTRAIRATTRAPKLAQRPTAVPIYQSATFASQDFEALADVLADPGSGYSYGRLGNPTAQAAADAVAELHGAAAGTGFATGMAAIHGALAAQLSAGDRVVATRYLYGSTQTLLQRHFARWGVETVLVDPTDEAAVAVALAERPTRLLYVETISNPAIVVTDIAAMAELAHRHGALLVVDDTFASPYLCRPLEWGADLVVESGTKWLGGHSDTLAGFVVGPAERVAAARAIEIDTGGMLDPLSAFLVLRGIATLAIRMDRHAASAAALAAWLERQAGVARVAYPGLPSHPQHPVASRQLRNGGGMIAAELSGGRAAGAAFMDAVTIPERTASLGSIHTMVVHPPTSSQRQLTAGELATAGIAPGLLRISVGLEDPEDLRADFERGLAAARAATESPVAVRA
jgi:methionine-gamma-lyase